MVQYDISELLDLFVRKIFVLLVSDGTVILFCRGNRQNIYGLLTISSANAILILTCFVRYVCYGSLYGL